MATIETNLRPRDQQHCGRVGNPALKPQSHRQAELNQLRRDAIASIAARFSSSGMLSNDLLTEIDRFFRRASALVDTEFADTDRDCERDVKISQEPHADPNGTLRLIEALTPKERCVLREVMKGSSNKIIAHELSLSEATVKAHVSHILRKLNVTSRSRAMSLFIGCGVA